MGVIEMIYIIHSVAQIYIISFLHLQISGFEIVRHGCNNEIGNILSIRAARRKEIEGQLGHLEFGN